MATHIMDFTNNNPASIRSRAVLAFLEDCIAKLPSPRPLISVPEHPTSEEVDATWADFCLPPADSPHPMVTRTDPGIRTSVYASNSETDYRDPDYVFITDSSD